jgi:hypothetical protein
VQVGDLVELSAKSLRIKSGGWPTVRDSYKTGIVLEVRRHCRDVITVLWNNGFTRVMAREELKYVSKINESR